MFSCGCSFPPGMRRGAERGLRFGTPVGVVRQRGNRAQVFVDCAQIRVGFLAEHWPRHHLQYRAGGSSGLCPLRSVATNWSNVSPAGLPDASGVMLADTNGEGGNVLPPAI